MKKFLKIITPLILLSFVAGCDKKTDNPPSGEGGKGGETIIVDDKDNSITINVTSKVYDGQPIAVTANSLSGVQVSLSYKVSNADDSTYTSDAPKNVGDYIVKASVAKGSGYKEATNTVNFSITKKEVEIVWTAPSDLVYDGTAKEASAGIKESSIVSGDTVNLTYGLTTGNDNVNVGSFTYTATAISNENYKLPSNVVSPTYTIGKATPTYTVPTGLTATYGQKLADVTLPVGFSFNDPLDTLVGNAGENQFLVTYDANNANYVSVNNIPVTIAVGKGTPTYTVPTNLSAVYGDTLGSIDLPTGYSWEEDPSTLVGNAGYATHNLVFTPSDTNNFEAIRNIPVSIQIDKASPYLLPLEPATAKVGDTLADITLPRGYTFMEDLATSVGPAGSNAHKLTYTPVDTDNYHVIDYIDFTVNVNKLISDVPELRLLPLEYREDLKLSDFVLPSEDLSFVNPDMPCNVLGGTQVEVIYQNPDVDTYAPLHFYTTIQVKEGTPSYIVPSGIYGRVGQTLGDVELPVGFHFEDDLSTPVGEEGNHVFLATYKEPNKREYKPVLHIPVTVGVLKTENNVHYVSTRDKEYDGNPIETPTVFCDHEGVVTYFYKLETEDDSKYTLAKPVDCGVYDVKAVMNQDPMYSEAIGYGKVRITRTKISISFLDSFPRAYDIDGGEIDINGKYAYNGDGEVFTRYKNVISPYGGTENPLYGENQYVDGVPTEEGYYYLQIVASDGRNYEDAIDTCVICLYSGSHTDSSIEIANLSEITATCDGNERTPRFSYNGVYDDEAKSITYYVRSLGSGEFGWNRTVMVGGTYELIAFKPQGSEKVISAKKFIFTIPNADYPLTVDWYQGDEYISEYYGKTLADIGTNGVIETMQGKIYFEDPLDTPVGEPGINEFTVRFVPNPIKDDNTTSVTFEPIVKTDFKIYVMKRTGVEIPNEIRSITLVPGTKLSEYALPDGWSWSNPNVEVDTSYANSVFDVDLDFAGDNYYEPESSREIYLNVGKLQRQNYGVITSSRGSSIYYGIDGVRIDPTLHLTAEECDPNDYDISIYDNNPLQQLNGFMCEFKRVGADDSTYTIETPSKPGDYVLRVTLFGNEALENATFTKNITIKSPEIVHIFEDVEEDTTYVLLSASETGSSGYAVAYHGINLGDDFLRTVNPYKMYDMMFNEPLSQIIGKDVMVIFSTADDTKLYTMEITQNGPKITKLTLGDPLGIWVADAREVNDVVYFDTIVAFYKVTGENIKDSYICIAEYAYDEVPSVTADKLDLSKFYPQFLDEFVLYWEPYGDYIHLLPDGLFPVPGLQKDEESGYYVVYNGEYFNYGIDEDDYTLYIYSFGNNLYTKVFDEKFDSIEEMASTYSDLVYKTEYIEEFNLYKVYDNGCIFFYSIDEDHNVIYNDNSNFDEEIYETEFPGETVIVYTLPDGSKVTYDFGDVYSYSYDAETNTIIVYNDTMGKTFKGVVLNDEDNTATYYLGELTATFDFYTGTSDAKIYVYNLNGQYSFKIYAVLPDGDLELISMFQVNYDEKGNVYEDPRGGKYCDLGNGTIIFLNPLQ